MLAGDREARVIVGCVPRGATIRCGMLHVVSGQTASTIQGCRGTRGVGCDGRLGGSPAALALALGWRRTWLRSDLADRAGGWLLVGLLPLRHEVRPPGEAAVPGKDGRAGGGRLHSRRRDSVRP